MNEKLSKATQEKYAKPPVTRGVIQRFPRALLYLAEVSAWGAKKHEAPIGDNSFTSVPDAEGVYLDALGRHLCMEAIDGARNPADADLLHAGQAAWNALARLEVQLKFARKYDAEPMREIVSLDELASEDRPEPEHARRVSRY